MAESRRYALVNQLDIEQILLEAQSRWLRPAEICEILRNYRNFQIAPEPPKRPPSGSLFLFDRKVLRYFRKDGHNWRKKKDGKTVKEAHERLKAGSIDVLHCYYAHGEENESFQRRSYWMLEEDYMHIVLVHYREVKGNKTNFGRTKDAEEVISNSQMGSPMSSSFPATHSQAPSQTTDSTSLNSAPTSEYEDAESADNHQASSQYQSFPELQSYEDRSMTNGADSSFLTNYPASYPSSQYGYQGKQPTISGINFMPLSGETGAKSTNDATFGLSVEPQKPLDLSTWEEVFEHCTSGMQGVPLFPSVSSAQSANMGYFPKQENVMLGKHFTDDFGIKKAALDAARFQEKWQMDPKLQTDLVYDMNPRFQSQKTNYMDLHNVSETLLAHPEQYLGTSLQNDLQVQISDAYLGTVMKSDVEDGLNIVGAVSHSSTAKRSLLDEVKTEGLTKLDSFTRWANQLGEVDEPHLQSNSVVYWDTVESEHGVGDSSLSQQEHLDAYLLSPSLSQEQLFSIIDFSPSWAYTDSETKVLISGKFLKNQDVAKSKWSCMFGEVEVPAEVLADGVLRCLAPPHRAGRVHFYVSCCNRLACSEVREFEFRVNQAQDSEMADSSGTNDMLLHTRLGKLLSLESSSDPRSSTVIERPNITSKITSLMKEDDGEWFQMIDLTSEKDFSPGRVKDQLLQKILKDKLHTWLLQKVTEEGKGPSVLDKEGQGVLHLAAALGYGWAIAPTIAAGVSINFRDVSGWTALHWAAFCGRERTVVALVQLGADPGALTDPSPKFPSGRTPADLASSNGHKGIAGYLAESSLTTHLSSLTLKDGEVPDTLGVKAIQTVSERTPTPVCNGDAPDVSLKDSLTAIRNATQAAARIHQVFRVQSFQKKQLVEYGDDKFGMSDERALSLITVKSLRPGNDEPVHTAAIRIQNKFRGWKGRKEFLITRQRIVKIQAHVRGHQVRKHYKKITWTVGIVEKAILRWRRKGCGLRGFKRETLTDESTMVSDPSKDDDYDFLKEGRKQTEARLHKALARVKSMAQYPEARDQYSRLLNGVTEFKETKVVYDRVLNGSAEPGDGFDDLIDIDALLDDDALMSTTF